MEEAKKSLRELYDQHLEASRKAYEEWTDTPFDGSGEAAVDREVLNRIGFKISKQALLVLLLHQAGELNASSLDDCIDAALNLLWEYTCHLHRALRSFAEILARTISESIAQLTRGCILVERPYGSPADWNRVPALAQEVIRAYESLIDMPNTRLPGIWKSLLQTADKVKELLEMEKKERQATGKAAYKGEASTGNPDRKRAASVMDPLVKKLHQVTTDCDDIYVSGLTVIHGLLIMPVSTKLSNFKIENSIFPVSEAQPPEAVVRCFETTVDCTIQPHKDASAKFFERLPSLTNSVVQLRSVLENLFEISASRDC